MPWVLPRYAKPQQTCTNSITMSNAKQTPFTQDAISVKDCALQPHLYYRPRYFLKGRRAHLLAGAPQQSPGTHLYHLLSSIRDPFLGADPHLVAKLCW